MAKTYRKNIGPFCLFAPLVENQAMANTKRFEDAAAQCFSDLPGQIKIPA